MGKSQTTSSFESENSNQSGTSTTSAADWQIEAGKGLIGAVQDHLARPATPYTGQRVGDLEGDELAGHESIRVNQGNWKPGLDNSNSMVGRATAGYGALGDAAQTAMAEKITTGRWDGKAADSYISPYVERVINAKAKRLGTERDKAMAANALAKSLTGNFGGGRHAVADIGTQDVFAQALEESQAQGYNDAWDKGVAAFGADENRALDASKANADNYIRVALANTAAQNERAREKVAQFNTERDRELKGGEAYAKNAETTAKLASDDASNLVKIGMMRRDRNQADKDAQYEEFLRGEDKFYKDTGLLSDVIARAPGSTTTTSSGTSSSTSSGTNTGPKQGSSLFSKVLGGAQVAASFF